VIVTLVALVATQVPHRGGGQDVVPPSETPGSTTAEATATASYDAPPPYVAPPVQPRPVNPRKRGPILFWFALAVMAVSVGALGVADLAGADVPPSAYPALVLALSGVFLLVGAFFGRAGGMILIGFLAAFATIGSTVADRWDPHKQIERPLTAADVQDSYHLDMGDLVVDLSGVPDLRSLDGRTIHVSGGVGKLDIQIPPGVTVISHSHVSGPGGISMFGPDTGGVNTEVNSVHRAGPSAPTLTIDADLHVGAIDLSTRSY
jgi:hypothetical protein